MKTLLILASLILFNTHSAIAQIDCSKVHRSGTALEQTFTRLINENLFDLQAESVKTKTPAEIQAANRQLIIDATNLPIPRDDFKRMTFQQAQKSVDLMSNNLVAGDHARYEREDTNIGYCFGRATCAHLQALKLGYKKEQIKKVWAVGEMDGYVTWRYHVGLIIRDTKGTWRVIDDFTDYPKTLNAWYKEMLGYNKAKDLQIFITDAEKFGPYPGKYNRIDLGLDLQPEVDFYNGYFKDLMGTMK